MAKMLEEKWKDLSKGSCPNHHSFKVETAYDSCHCPAMISFTQCAFDANDEALVAIDNSGIAYFIDVTDTPAYRRLGCVGLSTFLAFNPKNRNELVIGLSSTNIKVLRLNAINDFCSLTGHTAPPTCISFYKDYCSTSSSREVYVWHMKTYCKAHQLRLNVKEIVVKKAIFSSLGLVSVLYQSSVIQCWPFEQFDKDYKIDIERHGLKNVKDFDFTKDGRAMIVTGLQNKILVFNTITWSLLKSIDFHEGFNGGRQLSVVPLPLDGGANSVVAVLASDSTLKFISLATSSILDNCCPSQTGIKRIMVSHRGYFLASISKDGCLDITNLDKVLSLNLSSSDEKSKERNKPKERKKPTTQSKKSEDQMKYLQNTMKEELKLEKLTPILKEFGEYPGNHRRLIWTTIMELPNNKKAYVDLANKAPHQAMFDLFKRDPMLDRCKNTLLGTTVSCLLHWCPVLAECQFLPKIVAPFLYVFEKNPVLAFEACLFVLLNCCQKWFEYHPLPPLNILGMIENMLLEADPLLFNYFCEKGVTSSVYAWPLLQTLLSEVLTTSDWLVMWDHIFSLRKPWFLLMCSVAYNTLYRKTIMTQLQTMDDFQRFYKTRGHVSMRTLLKTAYKLDRNTPYRIHPRRYLENNMSTIPKKGPYIPFLQFEFPNYLTDELRGINMKKIREMETRLRGLQLHAVELLEEKRLRTESENFVKHVHESRLNEVRKCYENQVREDERLLHYAKKRTEDLDPWRHLQDDEEKVKPNSLGGRRSAAGPSENFDRRRRKSKSRVDCKSLHQQVERLEFEVQNLLRTLHSSSRSSRSRNK